MRKLWGDAGYKGEGLRHWVQGLKRTHKINLEVADHQGKGFQVVPKRWVAQRSFGWATRFRRLARDYERLPETLAGLRVLAFVRLMLHKALPLINKVHNKL